MRSFQRKKLDELLEKYKSHYQGIVLDIGGRDRGKFEKPKNQVEKWIFADIVPENHPDMILDVADMKQIESESIDVVNAIELFEHVEKIDRGLDECARVLKSSGKFIIAVPFMFPIHADPNDYQRWTKVKWMIELKKRNFTIEKIEVMGYFFTLLGEMCLAFLRSLPTIIRKPLQVLFLFIAPIFSKLDKTEWVKKNKKLSAFEGGYFIIAKKRHMEHLLPLNSSQNIAIRSV